MRAAKRASWAAIAAPCAALALAGACSRPPQSTLVRGATLVDGMGEPGRIAAVRVAGGAVAEIGNLESRSGERVVEGAGLVLAPGFVDTHSHADDHIFEHPDALGALSQGITTAVVGQDGGQPFPLREFFGRLERQPAAIHVASFAGHGTIRAAVMGDDFRRVATDAELERMRGILREELEAGALGLSSGLEYDPGIYSDTREVLELARLAAGAGGRYISHVRSEDRRFPEAVEEIIAIGRQAGLPVQISHLKLAMRSMWGKTDWLLARLEQARSSGVDITADAYPYTYWQSNLSVLFPERDFNDREAAAFALREVVTPDGLRLTRYDPEPALAGRTIAEIARQRGADPVTTLLDLVRKAEQASNTAGEGVDSVIGVSMQEADVERLLAWRYTCVGSDGELAGAHPRGFGAYTRVLGRLVRERGILSLEEAVRKMTSLAAANVGLAGRGVIRAGAPADLVLFNAATILDRATPENPHAVSDGVEAVWVDGVLVFEKGRSTGERPGRVLRRLKTPSTSASR